MSIIFTKAIPVLASLDFDATEAFYQQKLAFKTSYKSEVYLIMCRADLVLHFWACEDKNIAQNTSCYINVEGVDELYSEYEQAGVIHPHSNAKLQDQPHGMREFAIVDGDGNLLKFGQPIT
jgi:catechol 2,3-dioxygenase-like lactoylglutathione lyase family enzyme